MKTDKKYRIIKVTSGNKTVHYETQKKSWFGKWFSYIDDFDCPLQFETLDEAEKFIADIIVSPIIEVMKEY